MLFRSVILTIIGLVTLLSRANADGLEEGIRPFLKAYCVSCHGPQKPEAQLRLDTLNTDLLEGGDADHWQEVLDRINLGEMPPEDARAQPTASERQAAIESLTDAFRAAVEAGRSTGGRNVLRRLTAYEYNNTLRDLIGLELDFAADLPPEGVAQEGFKNNSSVLGTSALHLEYFERIARGALERVLMAEAEKPSPYFVRIEPERAFVTNASSNGNRASKKRPQKRKVGNSYTISGADDFQPGKAVKNPLFKLDHGELDGDAILLAGNRPGDKVQDIFAADRKQGGSQGDGRSGYQPEFRLELYEVPHNAPVRVRIRVSAVPGKDKTLPRLSFELGSFRGANVSDQKEAANIEISATEPRTYEFVVHGANFPFQSNKPSRPSYFRIYNDFRRGTSRLTYEELPKLRIDWVEITSNYYESWPPPQRQAILLESEHADDTPEYAREVIARFMTRAYRRPVEEHEVDRKVALYERLRPGEASFEAAMVSTLTSVLCSPHFLLHVEPATERRKLNHYELASRLSYFLWSSMPDDRLFELAEAGELHKPEVLIAQVERMMDDPKSGEFTRHFTAQWLDLAGIRRLAVNPEYFKFDEQTKDLFEEESIRFVHHVMAEDLSIANFIDSDFAVIGPALARHYRIPEIHGGMTVRRVGPAHHRGGLMTQASMLFGNSTGAETHPIKRGVWVLERMLDDPPPPPPPSVPDLPEPDARDESTLSLKERLIAHVQVETCRTCHQKIDPWGVAFENYNAIGQWREGILDPLVLPPHQRVEVDSRTQLKNGTEIRGIQDLKRYLLSEKREQFRRAVVRKVLGYSLGRYLEFTDQAAVDSICDAVLTNNDSFRTLIQQVVLSEPFLTK